MIVKGVITLVDREKWQVDGQDLREIYYGRIFQASQDNYDFVCPLFCSPDDAPAYLVCKKRQKGRSTHNFVVIMHMGCSTGSFPGPDKLFRELRKAQDNLRLKYLQNNSGLDLPNHEYRWNNRRVFDSGLEDFDADGFFPQLRDVVRFQGEVTLEDNVLKNVLEDGDTDGQKRDERSKTCKVAYFAYVVDYGVSFDALKCFPLSVCTVADGSRITIPTAAWLARDFLKLLMLLEEAGLTVRLTSDMFELCPFTGRVKFMTLAALKVAENDQDYLDSVCVGGVFYRIPYELRESIHNGANRNAKANDGRGYYPDKKLVLMRLRYYAFDCIATMMGAVRTSDDTSFNYYYETSKDERQFVKFLLDREWREIMTHEQALERICRLSYKAWGDLPRRVFELLPRSIRI